MKELLRTYVYGILAGLAVALGGTAFLSTENKMIGSVCFIVGLFMVCSMGLNLYTGKVCYIFEQDLKYTLNLIPIWLGNLTGTVVVASLLCSTRVGECLRSRAIEVASVKLGDTLPSVFILAIFCNIMIFIAVDGYKNVPYELGKYLALFFGVVVFIFCGFEHCVANMYYFTAAGMWSGKTVLYLIVMTLGNAVGGVLIPVIRKLI